MIDALLTALNAAGNTAMVLVAVALWRIDRRVVRIETHLFGPAGVRE